jgi:hypothetical protein
VPEGDIVKRPHKIIRTGGQRIAWTNTSDLPDADLVEAIKLVATEVDLDRVVVHFKHGGDRSGRYGRCYGHLPEIANLDGLVRREWRYLIIVSDAGSPKGKLGPRTVNTLAHEAKHVEQFRRGTMRRECRARNCEAQARAFGAWLAERWETRAE